MGTVSRISAAEGGGSPEAWCSVGEVPGWVRRFDKNKGSAAECSGSSGPLGGEGGRLKDEELGATINGENGRAAGG